MRDKLTLLLHAVIFSGEIIMDLKQKCSIAELKFFNDYLRKSFIIFRAENKKIQLEQESGTLNRESFSVIEEIFEDLGELSEDLNSQRFARYFRGFVKVINEIKNDDSDRLSKHHERTLNKLAFMVHDYESLLHQLIQCYDGPSKFEGVIRAFEVQNFKQSRILKSLEETSPQTNLVLLKA